MSSPDQADLSNLILRYLSAHDFALLQRKLDHVVCERGMVIAEADQVVRHVLFVETGVASQVAVMEDNRRMEVGIYGCEGFGPMACVAGVDCTPHEHFMQVPGSGFMIGVEDLAEAMEESRSLRALLLRYLHVAFVQTADTAVSNGSGVIGERLARWLLMCHDRVAGNDLPLTHEFLGIMLGVRRSGVTDAIHQLEGVRIIRATRGHIEIRDRVRLEDTAGDSYGRPEREYERLIGAFRHA